MDFIPFNREGGMAYPYDTRPLKVKIIMALWQHVGIPLLGTTVRGETIDFQHIKGKHIKFVNCRFNRCKFDGLKLVFITRSLIEFDTDNPVFANMNMVSIRNCVFKRVKKITEDLK